MTFPIYFFIWLYTPAVASAHTTEQLFADEERIHQ